MKFKLYIEILFFSLVLMSAQAQEKYSIDFGRTTSLKALFDLGLRPNNVFGMERDKCEVRNVDFELLVNNQVIPFSADKAEFGITKDDTISAAELISPNLTLADAQQKAEEMFRSVGSLPSGLEDAFKQSAAQKSFEPLRGIGVRATSSEPEVRIYFIPGDFVPSDPQQKHIRIVASAYWKSKAQSRSLLRNEKIKPPLGYEKESMEPILSPNQERLIQERKSGALTAGSPASTVKPRSVNATPAASPNPSPMIAAKSARTFPVAAVTILLLLVVAVSVFLATRRKSP